MRKLCAILFSLLTTATIVSGQIVPGGAGPVAIKWRSLESENFRLVFPEVMDSLAREYARSLESFAAAEKSSSGFSPNEMYRRKMPVIFHAYSATSNGMVTWAPRRMELYPNAETLDPESTPWITQLTVHESRHVSQMQFPRKSRFFRPAEYLLGELSTGMAVAMYPGPVLLEGDAVVAETALTNTGRGRTADFLEYYHVAFADSLYRDYWQWLWGSQRRYTPNHYRVGYTLISGMRTAFRDTLFMKRYYDNVNSGFLPMNVLKKTIIQGSGKNTYGAFNLIQKDFTAHWAAADSLRAPFVEGRDFVGSGRLFDSYSSLTFGEDGLYAIHAGLDRAREIVKIDSSGRMERLGAFASETSRLSYDRFNRRIVWSEHVNSALLEMKSFSKLRYMEDEGAFRTFDTEGRLYNPAASESNPVMAAVRNYEDGTYSVISAASNKAIQFEEYKAPSGLQPVEPLWSGKDLYVSAISDEGFSIYRLPEWKPVFTPAHSKINRLFARDGLIWFTSDRSGVNELHSVDPASGEILQRTSLRFGGKDFAFGPDSALYYCALTPEGRIIRRLGADSLLCIPVSFNPFHSPIAETLSAQEAVKAGKDEIPLPESKPYPKFFQPFRLHSWVPLYLEYNPVERLSFEEVESSGGLGATLMFQNELGTAYGTLGVSLVSQKDTLGTGGRYSEELFLPMEFRPSVHAQYVWYGWGPLVELRADYNERNAHGRYFTRESTETGMSFPMTDVVEDVPSLQLAASFSLPFNLSRGGWRAGIIPQYKLTWSNDRISSLDIKQLTNTVNISIVPHDFLLMSKASLRAYAMRPVAQSCIFPRFGYGAELGFTRNHNIASIYPGYYYGKLYTYLPGFMSTHGLRLIAYGQSNYGWEGQWVKTHSAEFQADYAFPFLPLDWSGLSPFAYVRNLEAVLHAYAKVSSYEELLRTKKGSDFDYSAGATLQVRLAQLAWIPSDVRIGIRAMYNFTDNTKSSVTAVFSYDL